MPTQALILDCHLRSLVSVDWSVGPAGEIGDVAAMNVRLPVTEQSDGTWPKPFLTVASVTRPDPAYFAADLDFLRAYSDLRSDRLAEIFHQTGDILSFFGAHGYLDSGRRKHTLLLLEAVRSVAVHVETLAKFVCRQKRPIDYAMEVQPMVQTPDHSSFPSGHALEAFAIATVLTRLSGGPDPVTAIDEMFLPFVLAHRIATNRTVAGVHFPVDSLAGAFLGVLLGEAIHSLAFGNDVTTAAWPAMPRPLRPQKRSTPFPGRPRIKWAAMMRPRKPTRPS